MRLHLRVSLHGCSTSLSIGNEKNSCREFEDVVESLVNSALGKKGKIAGPVELELPAENRESIDKRAFLAYVLVESADSRRLELSQEILFAVAKGVGAAYLEFVRTFINSNGRVVVLVKSNYDTGAFVSQDFLK